MPNKKKIRKRKKKKEKTHEMRIKEAIEEKKTRKFWISSSLSTYY